MMAEVNWFSPPAPTVHAPREQAPLDIAPFHRWTRISDDEIWLEFFRLKEGFLLRFPDLVDFLVEPDGTAAMCWPTEETDHTTAEHIFQSHVVPMMASANGRLVLHGGAVELLSRDGAVAFLGQSGRGKSTLTASFARDGLRFLSDDMLLLSQQGGKVAIQPGHPSIRVWRDSLEAVVGSTPEKYPPVTYTDKDRVSSAKAMPHCPDPRVLKAAFLLGETPSESIEITRLNGAKALAGWIESGMVMDIEDRALIRKNLDCFLDVSRSTPLFALSYPRCFEWLPDVPKAIMAAVDEV